MVTPLSPDQIRLIQTSWAEAVLLAYTFTNTFYDRLFTIDPSARGLFANREPVEQSRKFLRMLSIMVRGLSNGDRLEPELVELGKRHVRYGVSAQHYESMAAALLWTLERMLGPNYTAPVQEAWLSAYRAWTATMNGSDSSPGRPMEIADLPEMLPPDASD